MLSGRQRIFASHAEVRGGPKISAIDENAGSTRIDFELEVTRLRGQAERERKCRGEGSKFGGHLSSVPGSCARTQGQRTCDGRGMKRTAALFVMVLGVGWSQ